MPVHPDDDRPFCTLECNVHPGGHNLTRVIQQVDLWVCLLVLLHNAAGFISGHAVSHEDFHLIQGKILSQDGIQALADVFAFVADGKDEGDQWVNCQLYEFFTLVNPVH